MALNRREAREAVFELLFETEFRKDEDVDTIFMTSMENREIEEDPYIRSTYFGVCEHLEEIDDLINRHSNGWKTTRISRVSRSISGCAYTKCYTARISRATPLSTRRWNFARNTMRKRRARSSTAC